MHPKLGHARWFLDGKATAGVLVTFALLAITGIAALLSVQQVGATMRQVEHTHAVLEVADRLRTALLDAETAQRGYQLSGDPAYLDACRSALPPAQDAAQQLRSLTQDDPDQQQRVDALAPLLDQRLALLCAAVEHPNDHINPAAERPVKDENKQLMADLWRLLTAIRDAELALLAEGSRRAEAAGRWLGLTTTLASALALAAALGALLLINRSAALRYEAEEALRRREDADRRREQEALRRAHGELSRALVESEEARHRADELVRGVFRGAPRHCRARPGAAGSPVEPGRRTRLRLDRARGARPALSARAAGQGGGVPRPVHARPARRLAARR